MDKYEILSSDDETNNSNVIGIGLTPFFILLFLIITGGVGVFVTYEKIKRQLTELRNTSLKIFIINEHINKINNVLLDYVNRDKENEKLITKKNLFLQNLKNKLNEYKTFNFNYSSQIQILDSQINERKKLLDENIKINDISNKETMKLYNTLSNYIKEYNSLTKLNSKILDSDIECDLIKRWILGETTIKYNVNKCFEYLNESLNFNNTLNNYYNNCIEGNKKENNSLLILYQTTFYNRIGAFIKNKGKHHEQTNFVFNLNNKIKYDIADNLIQINNKTFPSFGLEETKGPYDIRLFYSNFDNSIQMNTSIIREEEVTNAHLLHIEIFILS